ncbi:tail fiber domain-containing protein [Fluviicola sp.]|uniref:tail fiber domain-containing protein n=1 Tax=Fluviicola sp. TaxID=1917219 RepID=UPI00262A06A6|nr:tail fiber domain-containing protein [Fluviicola sp.]
MKMKLQITSIFAIALLYANTLHSQLKVENDGSLFVNSYQGNWGRANWTKIHYQNTCAYHLWNTYYNGDVFYVKGDGYVWTRQGFLTASDSIFKTNIKTIGEALMKIKNLRGVTYNRKYATDSLIPDKNDNTDNKTSTLKTEPKEYGLIAQEVESIIPEAVFLMHDSTKAIAYSSLIPVLIEAIKEQQIQIDNLKDIINTQEVGINKVKNCCENQMRPNDNNFKNDDENVLFQNIPNPFNESSKINYYLNKRTKKAVLNIYSTNGVQIKSIEIHQFGNGAITLNAGEFTPGIYIYILIANDQPVDTKQMILTN